MLLRLDDFLIDRVLQPVVNKLGANPDLWARRLLAGDVVMLLCSAMAVYAANALTLRAAFFDGIAIVCIVSVLMLTPETKPGVVPIERVRSRYFRPALWALMIYDVWYFWAIETTGGVFFSTLSLHFWTLGVYVWCCRIPPPKAKNALDRLTPVPVGAR